MGEGEGEGEEREKRESAREGARKLERPPVACPRRAGEVASRCRHLLHVRMAGWRDTLLLRSCLATASLLNLWVPCLLWPLSGHQAIGIEEKIRRFAYFQHLLYQTVRLN